MLLFSVLILTWGLKSKSTTSRKVSEVDIMPFCLCAAHIARMLIVHRCYKQNMLHWSIPPYTYKLYFVLNRYTWDTIFYNENWLLRIVSGFWTECHGSLCGLQYLVQDLHDPHWTTAKWKTMLTWWRTPTAATLWGGGFPLTITQGHEINILLHISSMRP